MKILVIGNPVSGGGRSRRVASDLVDHLQRRGHDVEPFWTRESGDARRRATEVGADIDRLVVVGGDGTFNEVLNGIPDPSRIPLVQLATGTANILAHELKLPRHPEAMASLLEHGIVRRIDMGVAGERRFLMVVSAGFDAMVTRDIQLSRGGRLGYRGYFLPTLRVLRDYRPSRITIRVDGGDPLDGELVIVSNTRNYGGLFTMADRARCDSGHLDVCVLKRASLGGLILAGIGGLTGGISRQSNVTYLTGRSISLAAAEPVPVQIDGDFHGVTPIEIGLEPSRVPIVTPRG